MDSIILFTGIYDLFGLRLIRKISEKGLEPVYCLSSEESWNALHEIVNRLSCSSEREGLLQCMNNTRVIHADMEKQDIPFPEEFFAHKKISLWHSDKEVSFDPIYESELIRSNERIMGNMLSLCEKCHVSDINYISSIYAGGDQETGPADYIEDRHGKTCGLFEKIRVANEKFIVEKLKPLDIKVRIYRTPLVSRQLSENDRIEAVDLFVSRFLEFKQWVNSRIPEYFKNNALTVFSDARYMIYTSTTGAVVDEIVENYCRTSTKAVETIQVSHSCHMSLDELIKEIDKNLKDISVKLTDNHEDLNAVDLIFDRILSYHLPHLRGQKSMRSGLPPKLATNDMKHYDSMVREYIVNALKTSLNENLQNSPAAEKIKKTILSKNGKELTYYTAGQGEAILIINAYGVITDAWDQIVSELSKDYYVIVWQTRGMYNKEKPNEDPAFVFGVYEQVEDIEEIVEKEELKSCHIISWCSGVKAALIYYQKHKEMVKSQILLAGEYGPYEGSKKHHSKFRENVQIIAQIVRDNEKMLDFYMRIIHNGMFNKPIKQYSDENKSYIYEVMPEKHRDILLDAFTSKEKMVNFLNMCMEYYQHDITNLLGTIEIPVLFISAECDQIAPHEQSEWAHRLVLDSNYTCLPGATHLLILERPEDVMDRIRQHMKYYAVNKPTAK